MPTLTEHFPLVECPAGNSDGSRAHGPDYRRLPCPVYLRARAYRPSANQQFEHLATFVTVRRHYNGESFDTTDIHTGGGGDTGIDAIATLVNGSLVTDAETLSEHADLSGHFDVTFVFVQADRGGSFEGKEISDFGFGVKDFFAQDPKLTRNAPINDAAEIMDARYAQGTRFRPGNPSCRLYYVTTGIWTKDPDLDARRAAVEEDLRSMQIFRDVEFLCVNAELLQQFYR